MIFPNIVSPSPLFLILIPGCLSMFGRAPFNSLYTGFSHVQIFTESDVRVRRTLIPRPPSSPPPPPLDFAEMHRILPAGFIYQVHSEILPVQCLNFLTIARSALCYFQARAPFRTTNTLSCTFSENARTYRKCHFLIDFDCRTPWLVSAPTRRGKTKSPFVMSWKLPLIIVLDLDTGLITC